MEWLNSLFFEHTPLQAVVILSIIIAVGLGLGKIHLFGISLGVTFVFFAGILAGHLGFSIDSNMLNYAESFGLVLFVYELGLQVCPGFFSSFRKGGVQLNICLLYTSMPHPDSYGNRLPRQASVPQYAEQTLLAKMYHQNVRLPRLLCLHNESAIRD